MKKNQSPSLQSILAGIGVGSLLIYVLACATSFSPDDRQVLYPSFDPQSGATSVAVYDRRTGRSEVLFAAIDTGPVTNQEPLMLRAEWLADGKHVLICQAAGKDALDVLVLPRGVKEPVRHFHLADLQEAAMSLEFPFAISDGKIFLSGEGRNPLWVNLTTGAAGGGDKATNEVIVLPSLDGKSLVGLRDLKGEHGMEYGTIDPLTCQFKPVGGIGTNSSEGMIPAFNPADGRWMFVSKTDGQL